MITMVDMKNPWYLRVINVSGLLTGMAALIISLIIQIRGIEDKRVSQLEEKFEEHIKFHERDLQLLFFQMCEASGYKPDLASGDCMTQAGPISLESLSSKN